MQTAASPQERASGIPEARFSFAACRIGAEVCAVSAGRGAVPGAGLRKAADSVLALRWLRAGTGMGTSQMLRQARDPYLSGKP